MTTLIENITLFLTILEKGGLAAAGRELGLSPATVSERLAALERFYGATLLTRTTRCIRPTEAGCLLAEEGRRLIDDADELYRRIRYSNQQLAGIIRISAPVDIGTVRLVPLLDAFQQAHPDVCIDLNLTDGYVDLVNQGIDFAVRYGALADSTLHCRVLADSRRVVCASPDYLALHGAPTHPDELKNHDCIIMRFGKVMEHSWTFMVGESPHKVKVSGRRITNNGLLVRQWCLQGEGLCFKSVWDVQQDLKQGRLVQVLAHYPATASRLQIVYPNGGHQPQRIRALIDVIADDFASEPAPFPVIPPVCE